MSKQSTPAFLEPSGRAARRARAADREPVVEAAMARRVDTTSPMPEGYSMKALPRQMVDAGAGIVGCEGQCG